MAQVLIRAVTIVRAVNESGTLTTYYPGDWFRVGKQRAIELLESGQAEMPEDAQAQRALTEDLNGCGIYVLNGTVREARQLTSTLYNLDACEYSGALRLPWDRTLIWDARRALEQKQMVLGFVRVEDTGEYASWEVAAMLRGNEMLASEIGDHAERRRTLEVVGDLRIPVYDATAVWVRKTPATERFINAWDTERQESECEEHAFLRALYRNRVLLCSLPTGWLGQWRR